MLISPDDAQSLIAQLKQRLADAPSQLAGGVQQLVRENSGEGLERMMRSPARRAVLDAIFWQMPRYLDSERATRLNGTVLWRVSGRSDGGSETYVLQIEDGAARTIRGEGAEVAPRLTITIDGAELVRLAAGSSDMLTAYGAGKISVSGDMLFAARLATFVRSVKRSQ